MSRVLVTGAGGFIGRHTLAPLREAGFEVHAVSSRSVAQSALVTSAAHGQCDGEAPDAAPVRWHHADLLDPASATALLQEVRPTHLLHLAWCTQPGAYWTAPENLDWVGASLALLRTFTDAGGRRAVLAGTCAEYAWAQQDTHCVEGQTAIQPATLYGAAKHGLHAIAQAWAAQAGVELAWGRVFFLYGPHEHPERLASGVARALLHGERARCTHGQQVRDFLYVADLGAAFAALLGARATGAFNMAGGEPVRVADLVRALARAAGRPELVRLGALPAPAGEPRRLTADVARLREEVGWSPAVSLEEGARRTIRWWREHELERAA